MPPFKDRTGHRYGMLVALKHVGNDGKRTLWLCQCDCGKELVTKGDHLQAGDIFSCGCVDRRHTETVEVEGGLLVNRARFEESVRVDDDTGCHIWEGNRSRFGYGRFRCSRPRSVLLQAHRVAWLLAGRPLPVYGSGREIRHRCNRKLCVNPDHLELGTRAENMADSAMAGTVRKGKNLPGVQPRSGRFRAYFQRGDRQAYVGTFDTPEEAAAAAREAKEEYYRTTRGWTEPTFTHHGT